MDPASGQVSLGKPLDREQNEIISFQVVVHDSGTPSLNDTASITLYLSDANDNGPKIAPSKMSITLKEVVIFPLVFSVC